MRKYGSGYLAALQRRHPARPRQEVRLHPVRTQATAKGKAKVAVGLETIGRKETLLWPRISPSIFTTHPARPSQMDRNYKGGIANQEIKMTLRSRTLHSSHTVTLEALMQVAGVVSDLATEVREEAKVHCAESCSLGSRPCPQPKPWAVLLQSRMNSPDVSGQATS